VGDPLRPARFDEYAQSKVIAEKELIDSGLPKWVSLRQTGIFHPGMLAIRDPIMTYSPLGGVMEWVSGEDSARLIVNICDKGVPPQFWCDIQHWRPTPDQPTVTNLTAGYT